VLIILLISDVLLIAGSMFMASVFFEAGNMFLAALWGFAVLSIGVSLSCHIRLWDLRRGDRGG
jgi:hypothetical protein